VAIVLVSFLGGFLTFFSPCIFPTLISYFFIVLLISSYNLKNTEETKSYKILIVLALLFFGLSIIFILNTLPTPLQRFITFYHLTFSKIAGVIVIYFAITAFKTIRSSIFIVLLGTALGVAWIHCLDPVLSMIITTSNVSKNAFMGYFLLTVYALGLGVPFVLSGFALNKLVSKIDIIKNHYNLITNLSRCFLIIIGVSLIFTPWWTSISSVFVRLAPNSISNQIMRYLAEIVNKF